MQRSPMHSVIYDDLIAQVRGGVFGLSGRLPGDSELAKQYGVSRMTVRQAMDRLVTDEIIVRKQGVGTFVREQGGRGRRLNRLRSFAEELAEDGVTVASETIGSLLVKEAPSRVSEALQIDPGTPVHRLTRVRLVDESPAALQDAWVPSPVAPRLTSESLIDGSLYRTLTERYGVRLRWADQSMTAETLGEEQARLLRATPGGAVLRGVRTTYSTEGTPVEHTDGWTLPSFPLLLRIDAV